SPIRAPARRVSHPARSRPQLQTQLRRRRAVRATTSSERSCPPAWDTSFQGRTRLNNFPVRSLEIEVALAKYGCSRRHAVARARRATCGSQEKPTLLNLGARDVPRGAAAASW